MKMKIVFSRVFAGLIFATLLVAVSAPSMAQGCDRMQHGSICSDEDGAIQSLDLQRYASIMQRTRMRSVSCADVECGNWEGCFLGQCYHVPEAERCEHFNVQCTMGEVCMWGGCFGVVNAETSEPIQCGVPSWPDFACDPGYQCVDQKCYRDQDLAKMGEREHYRRGTTPRSTRTGGSNCPMGTVRMAEGACITPDEAACRTCESGQVCAWGHCWTPADR